MLVQARTCVVLQVCGASSQFSLLPCSAVMCDGAGQAPHLPVIYIPSGACLSAALFSSTVLFFLMSRQH